MKKPKLQFTGEKELVEVFQRTTSILYDSRIASGSSDMKNRSGKIVQQSINAGRRPAAVNDFRYALLNLNQWRGL